MTNKVYDVRYAVGQSAPWEWGGICEAFGKKVDAAARAAGETIVFHELTNPAPGGALLLVECSDAFAEKIKSIPGVTEVFENNVTHAPSLETVPSPELQARYSSVSQAPAAMKIYEVSAQQQPNDSWGDACRRNDDLGKAIAVLAAQSREAVYFRTYIADDLGGAPGVFVECSEALFAKIKELPGVGDAREKTDEDTVDNYGEKTWATKRSPELQEYFAPQQPTSAPKNKPPRFGM